MAPRLYLLHGPDEFASAEFVAALKEKMGDPSVASLNTTELDGRSLTLPELRSVCDALPFLAKRRLVIVEGWLTRLQGRDGDDEGGAPESAKETLAGLAAYLPTLPETTALVFVEHRTLPRRHPILKAAEAGDWGYVRSFDPLKGGALAAWIRKRAEQAGGAMTHEAAQALAAVETDPRALDNEIAKLLAYADFARPVDVSDVEALTPAGGESKIFDLVDAIGQRQGTLALRELHKLLENEEPLYVLGMVVRQFRLILQAKEMLEGQASEADISRALSLHPFPTGKVCAQTRNYTLSDLERVYRRLLDYDADIKTGQIDAAVALDTLVVSLTAT